MKFSFKILCYRQTKLKKGHSSLVFRKLCVIEVLCVIELADLARLN